MTARRTLLSIARRARVRIGYPCRGEGICGRCGVEILAGGDLLSPPSDSERALLARECAGPDARMSCLAVPRAAGMIVLRVGGGTHRIFV